MNFMLLPFRCEYYYKHYKSLIIIISLIFSALTMSFWLIAIYWYHDNKILSDEIGQLENAGKANHIAAQNYDKILKIRLKKEMKHSITQSILLHIVDSAGSEIILDTIVFTDDGFTITGMCTKPEIALAFSQEIKNTLKGVTINAKQGIDANRKIHTFQLSGKYEKNKSQS